MAKGDPRTGGAGYFPAVYQSALSQSAEDYDSIMGQYKTLGDNVKSSSSGDKLSHSPLSPDLAQFQQGSDYGYLKDFARTGGYSDSDVSNIRERAISPIRSIYDSASKNMSRQKNLQGGYAPNMGASQTKLARDMSSAIGDRTTAANAGIAQMVQSGKLSGATALAPIEARENEMRNEIAKLNSTMTNNFSQFNESNRMRVAEQNQQVDNNDFDNILKTIQGQQSTYGTTPALANTFGSQVLSAANTANNFAPITRGSMSGSGAASGMPMNPANNPNIWRLNQPVYGTSSTRRFGAG